MESSRLFVKNLPPSIKETDFRKHFALGGRQVTDIKLIPNRRIGFVGYQTAEEAVQAAKYFNRSYIRMSKIAVELARPIEDSSLPSATPVKNATNKLPTPEPESGAADKVKAETKADDANFKKRKRSEVDESDPKLKEFLNVMRPGQTTASRLEGIQDQNLQEQDVEMPTVSVEAESDDEYEEIPARTPKRQREDAQDQIMTDAPVPLSNEHEQSVPLESATAALQKTDTTDDDWLRSRTNRLLDLLDPDDAAALVPRVTTPARHSEQAILEPSTANISVEAAGSAASDTETRHPSRTDAGTDEDDATEQIRRTARVFVRNLPFKATEAELRQHFEKYGPIDEVSLSIFWLVTPPFQSCNVMNPDRDSLCQKAFDENLGSNILVDASITEHGTFLIGFCDAHRGKRQSTNIALRYTFLYRFPARLKGLLTSCLKILPPLLPPTRRQMASHSRVGFFTSSPVRPKGNSSLMRLLLRTYLSGNRSNCGPKQKPLNANSLGTRFT